MSKANLWVVFEPKMLAWLQIVSRRRRKEKRADFTYGEILDGFLYDLRREVAETGEWDDRIMGMLPRRGDRNADAKNYQSRNVRLEDGLASWAATQPLFNVASGKGPRTRAALFEYALLRAYAKTGGTGELEGLPEVISVPLADEPEADPLEGFFG